MLKFYESFQAYNVPDSLKGEILNSKGELISLIKNFDKINIFVGANNSGKSKLIRELIKLKEIKYHGEKNWNRIKEIIENVISMVNEKLQTVYKSNEHFTVTNGKNGQIINTKDYEDFKQAYTNYTSNYNVADAIYFLNTHFVTFYSEQSVNDWFRINQPNVSLMLDLNQKMRLLEYFTQVINEVSPLIEELENFEFSDLTKIDTVPRIYIPSIRTLREFGREANLVEMTKKEYDFNDRVTIFNGQSLPLDIDNLNNAEYAERLKLDSFQRLLSEEYFNSESVKLTYHRVRKVLLIKIGDEIEKPVHELGDGLQMIIILTFPFFSFGKGIIAIEEPELFLHPGLQKAFLKFLLKHPRTENFQILIATHSNHIIDSINQSELVSLFSLKKKEKPTKSALEQHPNFIVENIAFGNQNLLNLLGVTTTSVYLSNCTIWVEGITDKIYIQKFIIEYLKKISKDSKYILCKEYKEGINYSFALTSGDNIVHWDFSNETEYLDNQINNIIVRKFCSKSLVIVDSDFGKVPKRKEILKRLLNERFVELQNPEIENYLSSETINRTLLTFSSVNKAVGGNNLPIIDDEEFKKNKLGHIIDSFILKDYTCKKFGVKEGENSSLKDSDKFIFASKALDFITGKNLTKSAGDLVEQILDFIIAQNA